MEVQEFKNKIKNKVFKSTAGGIDYEFIPENTLRIKNSHTAVVQYKIKEEDQKIVFDHGLLLGNEPVFVEILPNKDRLEFSLTTIFSNEFKGTWIEQMDFD